MLVFICIYRHVMISFFVVLIFWEQQWDPDLVEATYIKDLQDNLSIIRLRFGENSKPLFHNREFIVYERRETMDDGTLVSSLNLKKRLTKIDRTTFSNTTP